MKAMRSNGVLERTLELLRSDDREALVEAARILSSRRGHAMVLLKALKTERRVMNRHAILYALGWQDDVRGWWPMVKVLADGSEAPLVRGQAAEGIAYLMVRKRRGSLGYRIALDVLIWALGDPSAEVRYYALFALGSSRDAAVLPVLRGMTADTSSASSLVGTIGQAAERAIEWMYPLRE